MIIWDSDTIILKKIEANCRYSIRQNLEEGKKNIEGYLKNYSPLSGVYINGNVGNIQLKKIQLRNQAILAYLKIDGEINITINGLK
jgi:hypothetical protein